MLGHHVSKCNLPFTEEGLAAFLRWVWPFEEHALRPAGAPGLALWLLPLCLSSGVIA